MLEALAKILTNTPKGRFSESVKRLIIYPALKTALKKLYDWTSDEEGIRYSETGEKLISGEEEVRFTLVICSAFVNYIIAKFKTE